MSTFNELIDFTRSTTGTYLDSVVYGDELVTNGTFDNNVDGWPVNTYGTIAYSNGTAILTNTDGVYRVRANQAIATEVGKTYVLTYSATGNHNFLHIGSEHFNIGINQDGPHSKTFVAVSNNTNIQIGISTTAVGFSSAFDNISVKEVIGGQVSGTPLLRTAAINEPRLEYDASGNPLGLLIEEARTNIISTSEALQVASNRAIAESSVSPTGEQTAQTWRVNGVTAPSSPYMFGTPTIVSGTTYTCSVFVRLPTSGPTVEPRYVKMSSQTKIQSGETIFDLQEGTVVSSNMLSESITPVGNGWYRISVTNIAVESGANRFSFILWPIINATGDSYVVSESDDGKALFETFGMQTEAGAFPTSYIPTSGSTVTRAADFASASSFKYHQNSTQGTLYVAFTPNVDSSNFLRVAEFGYSNLRFSIQIVNGAIRHYTRNAANNTNNVIGTPYLYTLNSTQKTAFTVSAGYAAQSTNGTNAQSETDVLGLNESNVGFYIGRSGHLAQLNGHIKQIQYYPKRLSNAQLQALTS